MMYEKFMQMAIEEAKKGESYTSPNPMVGCIIVKNERLIGTGYHEKYGGPHAERNAINNCIEDAKGAVMFVTLEPCCHYGKTPPCTQAIIESNIKTVIVGTLDPNPLVAGKGVKELESNGVQVIAGVLENECTALNPVFHHFIKTKTPYVVMKYAMTADGKIATYKGHSKWITNQKSRENVAHTRHRYASIMVGVNTVLADNPRLTSRLPNANNPVRIICDTHLKTPVNCKVVNTAGSIPVIIATACEDLKRHQPYLDKNCEIIVTEKRDRRLDLMDLMKKLGQRNINSILLEGGSTLNAGALSAGIINKIEAYIAPKIFGGSNAKTPVGGQGIDLPSSAIMLDKPKIKTFDDDILLEWEVK